MTIADTLHEFLFLPDSQKALLVQNNYIVAGIVVAYVYIVKRLGPATMRNRKPMDLHYTIVAFNAAMVLSNLYLSANLFRLTWKYLPFRCDLSHNAEFLEDTRTEGYLGVQLLILKIVELFDTVFFVLRKKSDHISFLHVFHHSIVVGICWIVLKKNVFGYYMMLICAMNTGVHVVMYTYYGLSAIGPSMQKYLWWKKYMTILQIMQFLIMMAYMLHSYLTGCGEFGFTEKTVFAIISIITALFLDFYFKAYRMK